MKIWYDTCVNTLKGALTLGTATMLKCTLLFMVAMITSLVLNRISKGMMPMNKNVKESLLQTIFVATTSVLAATSMLPLVY